MKFTRCVAVVSVALCPALTMAQPTKYQDNPSLKCLAASLAAKSMYEQISEMQMGEPEPAAQAQYEGVADKARDKFHATVVKGDEAVESAASKVLLEVAKTERANAGAVVSAAVKQYRGGVDEMKASNFTQKTSAEHFARRFKQLKCL